MDNLFDQVDLTKPDQVIRMVFCILYLKLARESGHTAWAEFWPMNWHFAWADSENNYDRTGHLVRIFHQLNQGSIRQLVKKVGGLSGKQMDEAIDSITSQPMIERSVNKIFNHLETLEPLVSEMLLELLFLIDGEKVEIRLLELLDGFMAGHVREGLLLQSEIYHRTIKLLGDKVGPELFEHYGLVLDNVQVFKLLPADGFKNKKVWVCSEMAGPCYANGFVRPFHRSATQQPGFPTILYGDDCIYLCRESIHIGADILAFLIPGEHLSNGIIVQAISECQNRTGADPDQRADRYRCWESDWVLWHEWGHLQEPSRILQSEPDWDDKYGIFHSLNELNASVHALTMFNIHGSEVMEHYLIARFLFRSGIGNIKKGNGYPGMVDEDLFILWLL